MLLALSVKLFCASVRSGAVHTHIFFFK
uniref:Uncharacterized protein n=1 Tax=Anguilla anguilla TaxID=7936 RepID=A0A0E9V186_ANGAN